MGTGDLDLDKIYARQRRALVSVSHERPNEYDPDHCNRAAYILTITDVPALLAEVERLRTELAQQVNATRELDGMRTQEISELRRVVDLVTELTHDTTGADLGPDEDIPVGEVMRALAGEPL